MAITPIKKYCLLAYMLAAASCNRNSIQLAPITTSPLISRVYGSLDSRQCVEITLQQVYSGKNDTIAMSVKNVSGSAMNNLRVVIEFCRATQKTYDNCNMVVDTTIASLSDNEATAFRTIFANRNIKLSDSLISVYVLSSGNRQSPLQGSYADSLVVFSHDTVVTSYCYLSGYIQADGLTNIRMKVADDSYYNITNGRFFSDSSFFGKLTTGSGGIAAILSLTKKAAIHPAGKIIAFSLSKPLADSSNFLTLNIKNH
ncbi:MAG: hypothetical protein V4649_03765 [Bacteroidota bacterium]